VLTLADLDGRDPGGCSISIRHDAALSDGCRVILLDDRDWSGSRSVDGTAVEEVERTARVVIGPDEPQASQTRAEAEANHWTELERRLRDADISTDGVDL
jgi:hypothetical protein